MSPKIGNCGHVVQFIGLAHAAPVLNGLGFSQRRSPTGGAAKGTPEYIRPDSKLRQCAVRCLYLQTRLGVLRSSGYCNKEHCT